MNQMIVSRDEKIKELKCDETNNMEIMKNMNYNFKISLQGKQPPLILNFKYEVPPGKTLFVFTSHSIKEPTFEANHKKYVNPVFIKIDSLDNDELNFEKPWFYLTFFADDDFEVKVNIKFKKCPKLFFNSNRVG